MGRTLLILAVLSLPLACDRGGTPLVPVRDKTATGPLRINPKNPRYFVNATGKAVYLTGSHTWSNLLDRGTVKPPNIVFDYANYISWMVSHNLNFMRLWTAELPNSGNTGDPYENFVGLPWKWSRTGPETANDGAPRFDFNKLDQDYFDRVRTRVIEARDNGIYVSVMLFEGEEWQSETNPNDGNPFQGSNNINGLNCPKTCPTDTALISEDAWNYETAYIRKLVDNVNDLDNVLYEVSNEAGAPYSDSWQRSVITFVKQYEAEKPKQHPVGMTFQWVGGSDLALYNSNADWVSPQSRFPRAQVDKVVINDTDHSYPWADLKRADHLGQRSWVWKNFTLGNNIAFMDPYLVVWPGRNSPTGVTADANIGVNPDEYWETIRNAMGATLTYANRMNLAEMAPQPTLSSTNYCLAHPGSEYLVYQPVGAFFAVNILPGRYQYEWLDPSTNRVALSGMLTVSGGTSSFTAPFKGDSVLYLHALATN